MLRLGGRGRKEHNVVGNISSLILSRTFSAYFSSIFFVTKKGERLFLNSDSTVGQGDKKLVNIIEDWEVLAEYAGEKLGFYQLLSNDGIIEIRVQTVRIGFKKEFDKGDDPLLTKILGFCKKRRFIQISENMRDDQFFK